MNTGRKKYMPTSDISSPPIVPMASGYQNASFVPIMNGTKPSMVDSMVSIMDVIFELNAFL